jgi:dipeptidyl aminopeptidase/acylaminoacyl peptidase
VIRPDGKGARLLPISQGDHASWSPDSRRLAFDDGRSIAAVAVTGNKIDYLTLGPDDHDPAWSPDGRTIAFVRTQPVAGQRFRDDLWLMDANGRHPHLIVKNAMQPAWRK